MRASARFADVDCAGVVVVAEETRTRRAHPGFAGIAEGTGVTVVTICEVGCRLTPHLRVAAVIRTDIVVITDERLTDADPVFAVVRLGTGAAIQAFTTRNRGVGAPFAARADVLGAGIRVITCGFVDQPITVVIESVTGLIGRGRGVAEREALRFTSPDALTGTVLVFS